METKLTRRRRKGSTEGTPNGVENEDVCTSEKKTSRLKENESSNNDVKINGITASTDLSFNDTPEETPTIRRKRAEIEAALITEPVDRARLRQLALSESGLINDDLRRKAWPLLLDLDPASSKNAPSQEEIENHSEYRQVVMDVNRSLKRFPPGMLNPCPIFRSVLNVACLTGIPYDQRVALQEQLTRLIMRVIMKYPHLCYYQGYHDVAVTFLLVVGEDSAFSILERLSTEHLRECMEPTMDTTSRLLNTIYPLVNRSNPPLYEYLERSEVGTLFCLPWFLTWFGHSLSRYSTVVRLYDFFLCSAPRMPLYVAASIVLHRCDELLATPCQMDCMHLLLSQLPEDLPYEKLLKTASKLYADFPPESIERDIEERTKRDSWPCPDLAAMCKFWWRRPLSSSVCTCTCAQLAIPSFSPLYPACLASPRVQEQWGGKEP
ncbi:hypothetical protein B566_EDAN000755 [Ephemera danica]|nr:hypothetical protein B566_EDAN000755 [Ephemera danica]